MLFRSQSYTKEGIWPRSPGAPTVGTASDATTGGAVNITFTAPSCTGSASITSYTAISTPGCITGSGASSPVTVSGLTTGTAYTFKVKATNGAGTGRLSCASNSVTPVVTCTTYTTAGTYSWVAPACVTSVSVVVVGGGGQGPGAQCCNGNGGGGGGGASASVPASRGNGAAGFVRITVL